MSDEIGRAHDRLEKARKRLTAAMERERRAESAGKPRQTMIDLSIAVRTASQEVDSAIAEINRLDPGAHLRGLSTLLAQAAHMATDRNAHAVADIIRLCRAEVENEARAREAVVMLEAASLAWVASTSRVPATNGAARVFFAAKRLRDAREGSAR